MNIFDATTFLANSAFKHLSVICNAWIYMYYLSYRTVQCVLDTAQCVDVLMFCLCVCIFDATTFLANSAFKHLSAICNAWIYMYHLSYRTVQRVLDTAQFVHFLLFCFCVYI